MYRKIVGIKKVVHYGQTGLLYACERNLKKSFGKEVEKIKYCS